jgi:hypothetical protein
VNGILRTQSPPGNKKNEKNYTKNYHPSIILNHLHGPAIISVVVFTLLITLWKMFILAAFQAVV